MIFKKLNMKKFVITSFLFVLIAGFFMSVSAQEKPEEYAISDSKYFFIINNTITENYITGKKINQKKSTKIKEAFSNFRIEKTEDRFNFDLVEKNFKKDIDSLIENYNIVDPKYRKTSKENSVFIIYSLPIVEKDETEKFIISALIYDYRITDELILFNEKIEKEEVEDYLKLLLNISVKHNPLTEEDKKKIFEINKNNYEFYKNNKHRIQIKYR